LKSKPKGKKLRKILIALAVIFLLIVPTKAYALVDSEKDIGAMWAVEKDHNLTPTNIF